MSKLRFLEAKNTSAVCNSFNVWIPTDVFSVDVYFYLCICWCSVRSKYIIFFSICGKAHSVASMNRCLMNQGCWRRHCQGRVMLSWDFLEVPISPLVSQISDPKSVGATRKFYPLYLDKEISALVSLCVHRSTINSPVIC